MEWVEAFISRTLEAVPECGYRRRTEKELRDHMQTEYEALLSGGRAPEEARAEVLRTMGKPEKLRGEYETAWRNTPEHKVLGVVGWFGAVIAGSVLMCILYVFITYPVSMLVTSFDKAFIIAVGYVTFLGPYTLEAAFLRLCFHRRRHQTALITSALLLIWALSNWALIILHAVMEGPISSMSVAELIAYFYSTIHNSNLPWMTPLYHLLTFLGCIFLGRLFGRIPVGKRKMAVS